MPEGPETRRAADRIGEALVGRPVTRVHFAFPHLRAAEPLLTGEEVLEVRSWGKAILIGFGNGLIVYCHSQLYGRWFIRTSGELPNTRRSLRLCIENHSKAALLYSASEIDVLEQAQLDVHPFLSKLGPDVLGPGFGPARALRRLEEPRFKNRNLGGLLLDQSFVAGIGNYLRSEVLFFAGLPPSATPARCDERARRELAKAIIDVSRRAYRSGGITNPPRSVAELRRRGARRREFRHAVYGRAGKPCFTCGAPVKRIDQAGRALFMCVRCQEGEPR